jgi:hypothetical protein
VGIIIMGHVMALGGHIEVAYRDPNLLTLYAEEIYEDIFSDDVPDDWFEFPEEDNTPYQYQDPFEFSSELEVRAGYKMLTGKEPTLSPVYNVTYSETVAELREAKRVTKQAEYNRRRQQRWLEEEQRNIFEAICEEFDKQLTEDMDNLLTEY